MSASSAYQDDLSRRHRSVACPLCGAQPGDLCFGSYPRRTRRTKACHRARKDEAWRLGVVARGGFLKQTRKA